MPISPEQQKNVWAVSSDALSEDAKECWQLMADYDQSYANTDAANVISTQSGGSLSPEDVTAALTELASKGFLEYTNFVAIYPASLPGTEEGPGEEPTPPVSP